ncbi:MAG: hypothetical protein AB1384_01630 [Actinomycetota bacterium]
MLAHIDTRGLRLHSRIPFPLNLLGSKYEYVAMKVPGHLTDAEWIYRSRTAVPHAACRRVTSSKKRDRMFSRGYHHAVIDPELCVGPEACSLDRRSRCFFAAIEVRDGKAYADAGKCHGCGRRFLYCPSGAAQPVRREHHDIAYCAPDLLGYE